MKRDRIITIVGFSIIPLLLINFYLRKKQLKESYAYTITVTKRQIRTLKNVLKIEHVYHVNGKRYKTDYSKDERLNIIYPGGRYLVRFSTEYPSISEVLWEKPVPDSILSSPPGGWKDVPF